VAYSQNIFKSYDVRGIYPDELNEEAAHAVGLAITSLVGEGRAVVGRDMRLSSPQLHQALIDGLRQGGLSVDDIEMVPIDAMYFAVAAHGYTVGVMVTASHNPPEYNGFKIMRHGTQWVRGSEIKDHIVQAKKHFAARAFRVFDIWPSYLKHVRSFVNADALKPLKVVVDAGNGMAGKVIPLLFDGLPFEWQPLFFELNGAFPNRPSNPLAPGAAQACADKVISTKSDVGIMFDGDTDRVFFLDEKGNFVPADITLLLLAKEFLRREPGAAIAYNLICSRAVPEFITRWGGKPIRTAVGYVNVSQALLRQGAILGGELSAHYSFRRNFCADSGMITALIVLELLSQENKPLSELVSELSPYAKSPEVNFQVKDKQAVLSKIKAHFTDAKIDELDGVTVEYPDWWCNVRSSNTEPLLRVTVEGNTLELMQTKQAEVIKLIKDT